MLRRIDELRQHSDSAADDEVIDAFEILAAHLFSRGFGDIGGGVLLLHSTITRDPAMRRPCTSVASTT
jgi:hypothetical protein